MIVGNTDMKTGQEIKDATIWKFWDDSDTNNLADNQYF